MTVRWDVEQVRSKAESASHGVLMRLGAAVQAIAQDPHWGQEPNLDRVVSELLNEEL